MSAIITVENLSKKYHLGQTHTNLLSERVGNGLRSLYRKLRGLDQLTTGRGSGEEDFWALRDVSFEVQQGDVVGIIGRNGAGKSTLLKILSRITTPTSGNVELYGRVASLLEVGTGFHPELTGRENVYLNGAILGMSKAEIAKKFDEIVAFAEVEKFISTPVKRYSSGMYVRLAFAVAAHLEPEILIIDEVLAVGDAQFQKKCLGKMEAVGKEGRTVLFVSHNINAIHTLCPKCVLLNRGRVEAVGATGPVVEKYVVQMQDGSGLVHSDMRRLSILSVQAEYELVRDNQCHITVEIELRALTDIYGLYFDFGLENQNGVRLLHIIPTARGEEPISVKAGAVITYKVELTSTEFAPEDYFCDLFAYSLAEGGYLHQSQIRLFRVAPRESHKECMAEVFSAVLLPKYTTNIHARMA